MSCNVLVLFATASDKEILTWRGVLHTTLCDKVCRWFSPGTPVSYTNKTDRHGITVILLKVALNTINQTNMFSYLTLQQLTVTQLSDRSLDNVHLFRPRHTTWKRGIHNSKYISTCVKMFCFKQILGLVNILVTYLNHLNH